MTTVTDYQDSIHSNTKGEFKLYIRTISDKSITVADALQTYRELKCLPKRFKEMTIQEVSDNPKLIEELYHALWNGMKPESKRRLSHKAKAEREREFSKR